MVVVSSWMKEQLVAIYVVVFLEARDKESRYRFQAKTKRRKLKGELE